MIKKILISVGVACWCATLYAGCTQQQLGQVQSASDKREVICNFVKAWSVDRPELKEVDKLCDAGADLKEIARAYGGCAPELTER